MRTLPIYQVDAFASDVFRGNPAAVMPLENWLPDGVLQALAAENNLSETAFLVPEGEDSAADFHIRWFAPGAEVPLCGHATLASAWVLFNRLGWEGDRIRFRSLRGELGVTRRSDGSLELDFPALSIEPVAIPELLRKALPETRDLVFEVPHDTNYLVVLDSAEAVLQASPDLGLLRALGNQGVIITAPGDDCDFVSRYFAPGIGIDEDPVTGSIHSALTPYWSERLDRNPLLARQLSARGGELRCEHRGDRVGIAGKAAFYMAGEVEIP
ncbi:PhzF family phenazine biosynthesis protein [Marinobacter sp. AN1]|uniref:PhzF family phenazine biosynthesis protein n=1 Tax=Marinobacter sp. AN1 TaxID=2886046 RepID=UPI00222F9E8E|nr:PhzF family phenazine biosynthesis protein [Marinobacter sp. AN1]UZD65669.1 PhzF family phenazine biosynthesis protein [Marinobacter sp. AN1]